MAKKGLNIVQSRVKEIAADHGCMMGPAAVEKISKGVEKLVTEQCSMAHAAAVKKGSKAEKVRM